MEGGGGGWGVSWRRRESGGQAGRRTCRARRQHRHLHAAAARLELLVDDAAHESYRGEQQRNPSSVGSVGKPHAPPGRWANDDKPAAAGSALT